MTQYGTWVSYGGAARVVLAIVLLAAAAGLVYAGTRLPLPSRAARPSTACTRVPRLSCRCGKLVAGQRREA